MPTFQPYGGWGWYIACLFPPSALSLFANVIIRVESGVQGLHWNTLGISVTSESSFPFSAQVVIIALIVDIILYAILTAYLDKVWVMQVSHSIKAWICMIIYYNFKSSIDEAITSLPYTMHFDGMLIFI